MENGFERAARWAKGTNASNAAKMQLVLDWADRTRRQGLLLAVAGGTVYGIGMRVFAAMFPNDNPSWFITTWELVCPIFIAAWVAAHSYKKTDSLISSVAAAKFEELTKNQD
jgi:hypothetical protein